MAEALARCEPVPEAQIIHADVRIALEPPMARYSLRARDRSKLEGALGGKIPREIGAIEEDVICLGPDEWLMRSAPDKAKPEASGKSISIVDVSERQVALSVEGERAIEVLQGGNPLDLENFPVGQAKRTIFEGVEIILIRETENRFTIEVWRSFAEFVWGVLIKSASEL